VKRTARILLTAFYLLSCLGMGISRLYCCGKLISVTLTYGATAKAGEKQEKKNKCCKNEKQSFKIKDSHFSSTPLSLNHPLPAITPSFVCLNDKTIASNLHSKIIFTGNAPPGQADIPVYTLNCTYRI
jgi:hypothetical protein